MATPPFALSLFRNYSRTTLMTEQPSVSAIPTRSCKRTSARTHSAGRPALPPEGFRGSTANSETGQIAKLTRGLREHRAMIKRHPRTFSPLSLFLVCVGVQLGPLRTADSQELGPRLNLIVPPGGQAGTSFEVRVGGSGLDGLGG